jgi:hypothetical protein
MGFRQWQRNRRWRGCAVAVAATASLLTTGAGAANASAVPANAMPANAALEAARVALVHRLVPNSAVGVDPRAHQVVLTISDASTGAAGLLAAARAFGPLVRVNRVHGQFFAMAAGHINIAATGHIDDGDGILDPTDNIGCSLGFNVTGGFAITDGQCAKFRGPWVKASTGLFFGPAVDAEFPGTDFGLLRDKGAVTQRGFIQGYSAGLIPVIGAANPFEGELVCHAGAASGQQCGSIGVINVTEMFPGGEVSGLIQGNICGAAGDLGGPLYDDSGGQGAFALGIFSGGIGSCAQGMGMTTFYQPIIPALNFYNVGLITA